MCCMMLCCEMPYCVMMMCCDVLCRLGVKWKGLSQKLEAAHKFAKALPEDDIILFTDAFDVMFTNSPKHILETYEELSSHGSDIIFAGECGCW